MTTYLWVEDFGAATAGVGEPTPGFLAERLFSIVFGRKISLISGANGVPELRDALKQNKVSSVATIFLKCSLRDADSFIERRLHEVDYIILDFWLPIESEIYDEEYDVNDVDDDEAFKAKLGRIADCSKRIHRLSPDVKANADIEIGKTELEYIGRLAGYHIFIDLVFNKGFPRNNILIYTAHGQELEEAQESFESVCIEKPEMIKKWSASDKKDAEASNWVAERNQNSYIRLRRAIIDVCENLTEDIKLEKIKTAEYRFQSNKKNPLGPEVTKEDIVSAIELWKAQLPFSLGRNHKSVFYSNLIKILVQFGDKVCYHDTMIFRSYELRGLAAFYEKSRHWLAHDGKVFNDVEETDLALFFLATMRVVLDIPTSEVSKYAEKVFLAIPEQKLKDGIDKEAIVVQNAIKIEGMYNEKNREEESEKEGNEKPKQYKSKTAYMSNMLQNEAHIGLDILGNGCQRIFQLAYYAFADTDRNNNFRLAVLPEGIHNKFFNDWYRTAFGRAFLND